MRRRRGGFLLDTPVDLAKLPDPSQTFMEQHGNPRLQEGSGWLHHAAELTPAHTCAPPMRQERIRVPFGGPVPTPVEETELVPCGEAPDGAEGDIWRCGCGQHWLIGQPPPQRPGGGHVLGRGLAWRPVTARRARRLARRAQRRT